MISSARHSRPASPGRAPRRRGVHRVAALAVGVAALLSLVSLGLAAAPAQARPEGAPHTGDWDGFDLYVDPLVTGKHGVLVETFSHSDTYCITLTHGWNAIPLQHRTSNGSGGKLVIVNNCRQRFLVPARIWWPSPNEIWVLDGGGLHRASRAS